MAIQGTFNLSNALESQAYAYKCWYNYNYGNNTMGISAQDMGEITQTWNGELANWQATAMDDENAYEIEDDDFSTAKDNGRAQAQDAAGIDGGNGAGRWIRAGEEVWSLTSEDNGEVILYAQWTANTYEIAYNGNGGTGEMTATPATYDQVVTLSANGFGYNAYTFVGWTETEDGTISEAQQVANVDEITESGLYYIVGENNARTYYAFNLTAEPNGTATIYAVWDATTYYITYDANGGAYGESVEGAEGEEYVRPYTIEEDITFLTDITLTGYTLVGYTISGNSVWTGAFGGEIRFADN